MNIDFTKDDIEFLKLLVADKIKKIDGEMIEASKNENYDYLEALLCQHNIYLKLFGKITNTTHILEEY